MTRVKILFVISFLLIKMWIAPVMATGSTVLPTEVPAFVINVEQVFIFVLVHTFLVHTVFFMQTVTGLTQAAYEGEKDACDLTFKNTVVDNMVNITVDQVTDITVEGIGDSGENEASETATVSQCSLMYTIQPSDPSVTLVSVQKQLTDAAQSGKMDESLHHYAILFSATSLINSTLSLPQVTNDVYQGDYSDPPKREIIVGLVIGSVVFFALLVGMLLVYKLQHSHQVEINAARQKLSKHVGEVKV